MDVRLLKQRIEERNIDKKMLILKYEGDSFIVDQYINEIASIRNKEKIYLSDIEDIPESNDFFFEGVEETNLYIINTNKFNSEKYRENCIVKCKEIDKNSSTAVKPIIIPKYTNDNVEDYCIHRLPGVRKEKLKWLCEVTKYDIFRIANEVDKISIFERDIQDIVFDMINIEGAFNDLSPLSIFNLSNALLKKDLRMIKNILADISNIDIEPIGLVTIMKRNIKQLLQVQLDRNATPDKLNMSSKQFYAVRYNVGKFTDVQLIKIFKLITSIDMRLKLGKLPAPNIIEYIIINMLI